MTKQLIHRDETPTSVRDIPSDFLLGIATSAYQIEGAWNADGRGPSIWDTFSQTPGNVLGDVPGDHGAGHYDRMEQDVDLIGWLGVDSYRLSLSWSRLLPDGVGRVNQKGVDFYRRLLDSLRERDIAPTITLYHWDLPQALEDRGGWRNRDVQNWFAEYADAAFARFGEYRPRWATLNEPIANWVGYGLGDFAPGHVDPAGGRAAMHHALLAHGRAIQQFRAAGSPGEIGVVIDVWPRAAHTLSHASAELIREEEADSFETFLNPLFRGGYSDYQKDRWRRQGVLPPIEAGDFELISQPLDFFGLNVYNRAYVDGPPPDETSGFVGGNFLDSGHFYDPTVAYDVLMRLHDDYDVRVPVYVTENGTANCNEDVVDGQIYDVDRIEYARSFLDQILRAADDGVDVRGYFLWSLLDNYEWSLAYAHRYGIVHVDFDTFERTPKLSAHWYRSVVESRRLLPTPTIEKETRDDG